MLCDWYEKLIEFLSEDDGRRCKYDDLTFPYKTDRRGAIKYLPMFKVPGKVRDNVLNIDVKAIKDPEALYWLWFRLLQNGMTEDQVPAPPSLNLHKYTFLPREQGQGTEVHPELEDHSGSQKVEKFRLRRETDDQRKERKQLNRYRRSLLQLVTYGRLETSDSQATGDATDDE